MKKGKAWLSQKGAKKTSINLLMKDQPPAIGVYNLKLTGAGGRPHGYRHEWRLIGSLAVLIIVFLKPVMKPVVGQIVFLAKLLLCFTTGFPNFD
jgi:hypothetical protein